MYVRVVVYPGAKRELVQRLKENHYELMVQEPAEQNLANRSVCRLIAAHYQVAEHHVRIVSGHHRSRKILSVPDTPIDT